MPRYYGNIENQKQELVRFVRISIAQHFVSLCAPAHQNVPLPLFISARRTASIIFLERYLAFRSISPIPILLTHGYPLKSSTFMASFQCIPHGDLRSCFQQIVERPVRPLNIECATEMRHNWKINDVFEGRFSDMLCSEEHER